MGTQENFRILFCLSNPLKKPIALNKALGTKMEKFCHQLEEIPEKYWGVSTEDVFEKTDL